MAAGRPSSNLRFMRMGLRRPPVARRLWCEEREIPLRRTEKADRNKRVCVCVCEREREGRRQAQVGKRKEGKKGGGSPSLSSHLLPIVLFCFPPDMPRSIPMHSNTLTHRQTHQHTCSSHPQTDPHSLFLSHPSPLPPPMHPSPLTWLVFSKKKQGRWGEHAQREKGTRRRASRRTPRLTAADEKLAALPRTIAKPRTTSTRQSLEAKKSATL